VVRVHAGTSGLDQLLAQRAQRAEVELAVAVATAGPIRGRRAEQPVGAHHRARGVVAHGQVIAEFVELVDVSPVDGGREVRAEFGGENVVAQALRGRDLAGVVGDQEGVAAGPG
jgi:hypothetical protein